MDNRCNLVSLYHCLGLNHKEIVSRLEAVHGDRFSVRTLKRILKQLGLRRRKGFSDLLDVMCFVIEQCEESGILHGYKWFHQKCLLRGLIVTQETIRLLLQILYPEAVGIRKRRRLQRRKYSSPGPNAVWHMDGYDKLKPYGISIHGCIDGYSRYIIWLKAASTNKNPRVVACKYQMC